MSIMARRWTVVEVTIDSSGDTSQWLDIGPWAGGRIICPSGYGGNLSVTFEETHEAGGTAVTMTGLSVTLVAGESIEIPDNVFLAAYARIKVGASPASDETLYVSLKG